MMTLYFQGCYGKRRPIKQSEDMQVLNKAIYEFCRERDYHIYYSRRWIDDDELYIDVGSHTEFFVITGPIEELKAAIAG